MADKRISESELVLPALLIIRDNPGITTSDLILRLESIMCPTGLDAEFLASRGDTHFSQKVRNLVSHDTLVKKGYTTYTPGPQRSGGGTHCITSSGKSIADANETALRYLLNQDFAPDDRSKHLNKLLRANTTGKPPRTFDENIVINEGDAKRRDQAVYDRSKKLHDSAIAKYRDATGHLKCAVCAFDFISVYGEIGRDYIEIHHQKPIFQYEGEDLSQILSEALKNVIPVCSNCHRMIHRRKSTPLSVDDLRTIVSNQRTDNMSTSVKAS